MAELLLQAFNKTIESLLSFLGSLVDTGIFQYLHEYQTDLFLDNTVEINSEVMQYSTPLLETANP